MTMYQPKPYQTVCGLEVYNTEVTQIFIFNSLPEYRILWFGNQWKCFDGSVVLFEPFLSVILTSLFKLEFFLPVRSLKFVYLLPTSFPTRCTVLCSAAHIPVTIHLLSLLFIFCAHLMYFALIVTFSLFCTASPSQSQLEVMVWVSALNNGFACRIALYFELNTSFFL